MIVLEDLGPFDKERGFGDGIIVGDDRQAPLDGA
jgi:hypothetical protein